jgi:hypothetical protein
MFVQWVSMSVVMLKKHFFKILVIYCLIKSFKALLKIKDGLIKENAFNSFPFREVLRNLIRV